MAHTVMAHTIMAYILIVLTVMAGIGMARSAHRAPSIRAVLIAHAAINNLGRGGRERLEVHGGAEDVGEEREDAGRRPRRATQLLEQPHLKYSYGPCSYGLCSRGLGSYGLCSFGLCSYGLCSFGLCSYGLDSYGLGSYGLYSYGLHIGSASRTAAPDIQLWPM